jgi:hypothetical protein
MNRMSEMILTMNSNFSRLLPTNHRTASTPPPTFQNHTFSTPHHHPPHSLSPIPEIITPATTPITDSYPPCFGKLTPDKLPHPTYPPKTQTFPTQMPVYTDAASVSTSHQPLQQHEHVF